MPNSHPRQGHPQAPSPRRPHDTAPNPQRENAEQQILVRKAVHGDPAATEALMAVFLPQLVRYCRARLGRLDGSYTTADDVAQEACIGILRALPCWKDQGKPFAALVFAIAANKVADAQRSTIRSRKNLIVAAAAPDRPDTAAGPEHHAVNADLARRAFALLDQLPEPQREIVVLRIGVGLTADEVGTIVGMTAAAVRMAQSRAIARLRKMAADSGAAEVAA